MKKICSYCGKIHEKKYICPEKRQAQKARQAKTEGKENRFRSSGAWKRKAARIKRRDCYLCQACIRQMQGTERRYNTQELSVHHIIRLRDDYDRRLDDDNLITLCRVHHDMAERGVLSAAVLWQITGEQEASSGGWTEGIPPG